VSPDPAIERTRLDARVDSPARKGCLVVAIE
jgi:hypothetical protein